MEVDSLPQHLSISIAQHEGQKATEAHGDMQQARAVASPFTAPALRWRLPENVGSAQLPRHQQFTGTVEPR